ncbi:asparagine synthase-related protein [Micromonospora sp. R77]|uniref:asparagine synthase-related protein n=1 Tax=Micromonospora sp. R77 TaxID=2925836 RepID=UPI001F625113|nr:asparagine synthase-related protein [Micromonospora sp. R77]MCI4064850.1 asparagine synthase-related protein [Micromonospora sp. R77]
MTDPTVDTRVAAPWPSPYELATGLVTGVEPADRTGPPAPVAASPLAALEAAVLPALRRPPCLVSFSGGLDSSMVLAVAARVAARHGLPAPVPVTWRFTDAPAADESDWQDRVVDELRLRDRWQILPAADDLDLVGPVAQRFLRRYGVCHPLNTHLHLPIVELAAGGSLLTGVGGDQILAGWRPPPPASPYRRLRLRASRLRARLRRAPSGIDLFPWLRPAAARDVLRRHRAERRAEPDRLDRRMAWHLRRRDLRLTVASFDRMGADHAVLVRHPFLDPGFVATLAATAGGRRGVSRRELLAELADGHLPPLLFQRQGKAHFLDVFLRAPTREFVRGWDGGGVDESVVDPAALRAAWARWPIPECTAGLVQHLWLRQHGSTPRDYRHRDVPRPVIRPAARRRPRRRIPPTGRSPRGHPTRGAG